MDRNLNKDQITQWFNQASPDDVISVLQAGLQRVETFDPSAQERFRSGIPSSVSKLMRQTA